MSPEHLSLTLFHELYGPRKTQAYNLIHDGKIEAVKIGRNTYVTAASARRWADSLPRGIAAEPEPMRRARQSVRKATVNPSAVINSGSTAPHPTPRSQEDGAAYPTSPEDAQDCGRTVTRNGSRRGVDQ